MHKIKTLKVVYRSEIWFFRNEFKKLLFSFSIILHFILVHTERKTYCEVGDNMAVFRSSSLFFAIGFSWHDFSNIERASSTGISALTELGVKFQSISVKTFISIKSRVHKKSLNKIDSFDSSICLILSSNSY